VIRLALAIIAALAVATVPAVAQTADEVNASIDTLLGDHTPYEEAFAAIQAAVADDDAETVAAWVAYPFSATINGEDYALEGPEGFVEHYDGIVTEEVKVAVVEQKYEELFVNAEGIMVGNGQMWLSGICKDYACAEFEVRIITIQSTAAN